MVAPPDPGRPPRPLINFGDLARVRESLEITDPAVLAEVSALLGLDETVDLPRPRRASSRTDGHTTRYQGPLPAIRGGHRETGRDRGEAGGRSDEAEPPGWRVVSDVRKPVELPDWWDVEPLLPADPAPGPARRTTSGTPTLFPPGLARAILSGALSVPVPEGDVDEESATEVVAGDGFLESLPRLPVLTTRFGAQVLLDVGPGMQPYFSDVAALPGLLRSVFGTRLDVLRFDTSPDDAGPYGRPWPPYRPPAPGTPVLVVTSFGVGGELAPKPAPTATWIAFVHAVRHRGSNPIALVPGPAPRLDPELARVLPVLAWERGPAGARLPRRRRHGRGPRFP